MPRARTTASPRTASGPRTGRSPSGGLRPSSGTRASLASGSLRRSRPIAPARPRRSAREELLALHRRIFEENKRRIDRSTIDDTGELKRYRGAYTRACGSYRSVASFGDVVDAALDADVVYVGDYHTSKQSQKTFLKLAKRIQDAGREVVFALELVQKKHQGAVDRFLAGQLGEAAFLEAIRFRKNWPFDNWENFRPIFALAREAKTRVVGIDAKIGGSESLSLRDAFSGEVIAREIAGRGAAGRNGARPPRPVVLVLIGDLHIAPSHLPAAVDRALAARGAPRSKPLLVFQNSERIYWRLAAEELERSAEVVRVDERSFCVMNTPPIILQQTYLNWLEREEDVLDYADARTEFLTLLRRIAGFLELPLPPEAEEVEVYTCGDLSFLHRLRARRVFREHEIDEIKRQILSAESYFIPRGKMVYLANLSTNHAAEEASHYLKVLCAPEELPKERSAAFYANALHEAIGFFGSKIINDRRKTPHEDEFRRLLRTGADDYGPSARRIARLVLAHKEIEKLLLGARATGVTDKLGQRGASAQAERRAASDKLAQRGASAQAEGRAASEKLRPALAMIHKQPVDLFIGVTHALGYMLGEKLFYGMVEGSISRDFIRELYDDPFTAPGRARARYFELVERVRDIRVPERM